VEAQRPAEPEPKQPLQVAAAAPERREPLPAALDPLLKTAPAIASFLRLNQEGSSDGVTIAPDHEPLRPLTLVQSSTPAFSAESVQPTVPQPVKLEVAASPEPADLGVEHQLDMAHEGEWLDRLAKDIAQSAGSDSQPLRFRLNPETLGSLRVEISQDRNGAAVRLTADTEAARAIIAEAQPRLIAEARAQGIRISEAHVDVGSHTASGDQRRQNGDFEEVPLRTARSLQDNGEGDGNPTPGRSERYA
jgi:flagellar hook-length control protein FliK